jgi:predicted dehydrogenase
MPRQTRRDFLQSSLAAAGVFAIAGTKSSGKVLGSNDAVRVAVAGLNGRGAAHVGAYLSLKDVDLTYLIDPDSSKHGKYTKTIDAKGKTQPKTVTDVRKVLEDKNVDAVSIATPNHWHALMTIWSCQADKDVYVEKPCSHNVHEGRIAVEMARKHKRIVQHGTQSRSSSGVANIMEIIKSGAYGKLLVARGLCYKSRKSIGMKPNATPPAEVDFNIWLGPAPEQPFHANLVHYNWHWFWDFGNGDIGNQGVHEMDKARWATGGTLPKSVLSLGGRFGYTDQGQTPNTQMAVFDYGETQVIFEVRGLPTKPYYGQGAGNTYHLEEGMIAGEKFYPKGGKEPVALVKPKTAAKRGPGGGDNFANFIAAVRSRKVEDLNADILEAHYSSALCHLANISYRLGTPAPFSAKTKAFGDNKEAYETLGRLEEHLGDNGLKLEETKYQLGKKLAFDAKTEKFVDDDAANKLLTREYRKDFSVPDKV